MNYLGEVIRLEQNLYDREIWNLYIRDKQIGEVLKNFDGTWRLKYPKSFKESRNYDTIEEMVEACFRISFVEKL